MSPAEYTGVQNNNLCIAPSLSAREFVFIRAYLTLQLRRKGTWESLNAVSKITYE